MATTSILKSKILDIKIKRTLIKKIYTSDNKKKCLFIRENKENIKNIIAKMIFYSYYTQNI